MAIPVITPLISALGHLFAPFGFYFSGLVQARNANQNRGLTRKLDEQRQQTQLKLAYINIASQAALQERRQVFQAALQGHQQAFQVELEIGRQNFQERMACLQFERQITLERARQAFQERLSQLNYQQQLEIQKFVQSVNLTISQKNLDFQKWRFEQERILQQQLATYNRETQFALAAYQRETALKSTEARKLFENWPLILVPAMILNSHQGNGAVPLRVLISPPKVDFDKFEQAATKGFPKIEKRLAEGLRQFLSQNYPLNNRVRPVELLDGAWDSKRFRGGSSIKVLFGMLKSEPTLILESEVDGNYLNFRLAYWGLGHSTYCYEQIISRLPYGEILYESAKSRALKWKETRKKLLAAGLGKTVEDVDKLYGGDNPDNLKRLEAEKRLKEAGIASSDVKISYKVGSEDWEVLCQVLVACHSIVAAWMADAHYLIHGDVLPLLPQLLPSLLSDESGLPVPEVIQAVVSGYHGVFKALEIERASWIPELALQLAWGLASLPDKSWSKEQVVYSTRSWLQQRIPGAEVKDNSLLAIFEMMKPALIAKDQNYLEKLRDCLLALEDSQGSSSVQSLLNNLLDDQLTTEQEVFTPIPHFAYPKKFEPIPHFVYPKRRNLS